MLTERGKSWHAFSIAIALVFLVAMLVGAVFAATSGRWILLGVFTAVSIFQVMLIVYVVRGRGQAR